MFRAVPRLARSSGSRLCAASSFAPARRYLSTAPPAQQKRSWKSLAVRLGIAGGVVYWWNERGAVIFAEERSDVPALQDSTDDATLPTIESLSAERAARKAATASHLAPHTQASSTPPSSAKTSASPSTTSPLSASDPADPAATAEDPEHLEAEAGQQGAFNPETGEINWDCSCLGGMAHGPCGPEFREAFSCFVYSQAEPKGVDCVEKFKGMQNCFRQHPDVYGSELEGDGEDDDEFDELEVPVEDTHTPASTETQSTPATSSSPPPSRTPTTLTSSVQPSSAPSATALSSEKSPRGSGLVPDNYKPSSSSDTQRANAAAKDVKSRGEVSESEAVVPKSACDGREAEVDGGRKVERRN